MSPCPVYFVVNRHFKKESLRKKQNKTKQKKKTQKKQQQKNKQTNEFTLCSPGMQIRYFKDILLSRRGPQ